MNSQEWVPFKTVIRVSAVTYENGKKYRKQSWDGVLVGHTTRGLFINPFSEYGESLDPFIAFSDSTEFEVVKTVS